MLLKSLWQSTLPALPSMPAWLQSNLFSLACRMAPLHLCNCRRRPACWQGAHVPLTLVVALHAVQQGCRHVYDRSRDSPASVPLLLPAAGLRSAHSCIGGRLRRQLMEREPWQHQPSLSMGAQQMRTAALLSKDSLGPQGATGCWHSACLAGRQRGIKCNVWLAVIPPDGNMLRWWCLLSCRTCALPGEGPRSAESCLLCPAPCPTIKARLYGAGCSSACRSVL